MPQIVRSHRPHISFCDDARPPALSPVVIIHETATSLKRLSIATGRATSPMFAMLSSTVATSQLKMRPFWPFVALTTHGPNCSNS
jgi:hypothetical protein